MKQLFEQFSDEQLRLFAKAGRQRRNKLYSSAPEQPTLLDSNSAIECEVLQRKNPD